jgi:UDP-N-acetylmuramate dehydrogenase
VRALAGVPLSALTTLRLGGPAARLLEAETAEEVVGAVVDADAAGEQLLVLGGGSNLVVADDGFAGTVVAVRSSGVHVDADDDVVRLRVAAGEPWEPLVETAVAEGWAGIEALSGIPGSTGATPIQNVGAYGQEVSSTVSSVTVLDRPAAAVREVPAAACGFRYRTSVFKGSERYVVLAVTFTLERSDLARPLRYGELARVLGAEPEQRIPMAAVRQAVLGLRRGKGMVLDPADPDSVSAGSFFTNPVLTVAEADALERRVAARLGPQSRPPRWPDAGGRVKTSAAWLIERAGFGRGYGHGPVRVSGKHTLALTNRGGATTEDLLALAREIRDGVREAFGVELVNEPVLVGARL